MNLNKHLTYCNEQIDVLTTIRTTADALLNEDPTTLVISREQGHFVRFESGQVTPASLLMEDGVEDIADDPQALGETAQGMNETYLKESMREFNESQELASAVSAAIRQLRGETIAEDEPGLPTVYRYERVVHRSTTQRVGEQSVLIGSVAFSGLEYEQEASVWSISAGSIDKDEDLQLVYLRDQPVLAQWEERMPGPHDIIDDIHILDLPSEVKDRMHNIMFSVYNDREDPDAIMQEIYFQYVGTPQEPAISHCLDELRAYTTARRRNFSVGLLQIPTPTPDELCSIAVKLNALRNA